MHTLPDVCEACKVKLKNIYTLMSEYYHVRLTMLRNVKELWLDLNSNTPINNLSKKNTR